jgi:hypothetical protein
VKTDFDLSDAYVRRAVLPLLPDTPCQQESRWRCAGAVAVLVAAANWAHVLACIGKLTEAGGLCLS